MSQKPYRYSLITFVFFIVNLYDAHSQTIIPSKYRRFALPSVYQIVEVIDARKDKTNIGLILNEAKKQVDTVQFAEPLELNLKNALGYCIPKGENEIKYSLALKVNYVEFNKRKVEDHERFWIFYDIEFYVKNTDNTYTKVYDGIEMLEGRADFGHTKDTDEQQFSTLHWLLWEEIHTKINTIRFKNLLKNIPPQQLDTINQTYEYFPIFRSDSLRKGNYDSVSELNNNSPSINVYDLKEPMLVSVDSTNKEIKKMFYPNSWYYGYSNGKSIYLNYDRTGNFVPIERLGTVFEIEGFANKIYNIKEVKDRMIKNVAFDVSRTFLFPTRLNAGLAAASAVGLLVNMLRESPNTRLIIDSKHDGKVKKMPFTIIREK